MTTVSLIGDAHIGNSHFREQNFIHAIEKADKIVIMGDLIEGITKKDKRHSNQDSILTVDEQIIKSIDILKPYKDKIIMYVIGNHESTVISMLDINPMTLIGKSLDIPTGITELIEIENTKLWVSHGTGAPITYSGVINQLEKFAKDYIGNINAIGHTHKLFDIQMYRHPHQKFTLVNTGTFLYGAEYAEKMKLPPAAIGYYKINMKTSKATRMEYK